MRKRFYLACAALSLTALSASAQYVIETDMQITEPGSWTDMATAESIIISEATVTFTKDAFNICGFPTGVPVTLTNGARVVMFDSPDLWSPDVDAAENEDYLDLYTSEGDPVTHMPYEFIIDDEATIVADSKCFIGGKYTGTGTLTLCVGDSTVLAANFGEFKGTLIIEKQTPDAKLLIGVGFPGYREDGSELAKYSVYGGMPWTMQIPDGLNITTYGTIPMALPQVIGKGHIEVSHFFIYRPTVSNTFECTVSGGADGRSFEYYAEKDVTTVFTEPIDFVGSNVYVRAANFGIFFNSDPSIPTFSNMTGGVSMRNGGAFVGGTGYLGCSIDGKEGVATRIIPGAAENTIGVLRAAKDIWFNNNNNLDIDFGANGKSDVLITDQAVRFNGEFTRLTINLTDEFYANPKAGDYRLIDAQEYIGNVIVDGDTGAESTNNNLVTLSPQINAETAPTIDDILPAEYSWDFSKFFTEGIVSLLGPGYEPGVIVNDPATSLEEDIIADKEVASRQYYSINGMLLNTPEQGFNIVRTQYTDGTVKVEKIFKN